MVTVALLLKHLYLKYRQKHTSLVASYYKKKLHRKQRLIFSSFPLETQGVRDILKPQRDLIDQTESASSTTHCIANSAKN